MKRKDGLVAEGVLHQPAIAIDEKETVWVFWAETSEDSTVNLKGRPWTERNGFGKTITLADSDAAEAFVDAGTDSKGRVWITWQSLRAGEADVFSAISITKRANGRRNWQYPMLREATGNHALPSTNGVMHGSFTTVHVETNSISTSRGLNRTEKSPNIPLVTVRSTKPEPRSSRPLTRRVSGSPPSRARRNTGSITEDTGTTPESMRASVSSLENLTWNPRGSMKYQWGPRAGPEFPPTALWWASARMEIPGSPTAISTPPFGELPLPPFVRKTRLGAPVDAYPQAASDRIAPFPLFPLMERVISVSAGHPTNVSTRLIKPPQSCSPPLPSAKSLPEAQLPRPSTPQKPRESPHSHKTPERPAFERHQWTVDGQTYGLYWGGVHRHTDVSNCRTGFDGCILDHFRYAYDLAKIDFLGTSDHTDVGKPYHPYEWWHNQRMHDALHSPGHFNTVYVYEREQRWPWGHRNIVFAHRGGPIVYIKRTLYLESPWQRTFPVETNASAEISPYELWDLLKKYDKPVAALSHTGATGMGTDWKIYEKFDYSSENAVEIYQGARVSYEAAGAPQPTVGLRPGASMNSLGKAPKQTNRPNHGLWEACEWNLSDRSERGA